MNEGSHLDQLEAPNLSFFPFTKLPPDVQYNVVQSLCGHCGKEDDPVAVFYHDPSEQTKTLGNLCLVSREMRSLAQSILYHYPRIYSYTSFFRTLQYRPELADSVKVQKEVYEDELWRRPDDTGNEGYYDTDDGNDGSDNGRENRRENGREQFGEKDTDNGSDPYREDLSYLRSLAAELKLDNTDVAEFEEAFRYYPSKHREDDFGMASEELCRVFDNMATCIIMALCKRLEFLAVNLRDKEYGAIKDSEKWPTKYAYLPGLVKHMPEGEQLRHVHTLVLRNTKHLNSHMLGLDRAAPLWQLLPSVTSLVLFCSTTSYQSAVAEWTTEYEAKDEPQPEYLWPALPSLKELRFVRYGWSTVDLPYPAIERMVSRCTELERLTFSPLLLYKWPFRPSKLLQAILSLAPTLRHLVINCTIPNASYLDSTCVLGAELKQFTNLESLVLDQAVFCHHHHDPENATRAATCLANIIPDNLQSLTVNLHALLSPVIDIVALGDAKARGEFRKLRYLRVQMTFEDKCWPDSDPPPTPRSPSAHLTTYEPKEGRPDEVNLRLMAPRKRRQRQILDAFKGTGVDVQIDFFRRRMHSDIMEHHVTSPVDRVYTDARLVDKVE